MVKVRGVRDGTMHFIGVCALMLNFGSFPSHDLYRYFLSSAGCNPGLHVRLSFPVYLVSLIWNASQPFFAFIDLEDLEGYWTVILKYVLNLGLSHFS